MDFYPTQWQSNDERCQQPEWVAMRTSCELGLYPALAADKEPKTLAEPAQATGADATLLRTLLEVLIQPLPLLTKIKVLFLRAGVSFGSIKEIGLDHYGPSPSYAPWPTQ